MELGMDIVMDIGGTNLRVACFDQNKNLSKLESWPCLEFSGPEQALKNYLAKHNLVISNLCIAIAAPLMGDQITMTNLNWSFSAKALKQQFSLNSMEVVNDYHALGFAIPTINQSELVQIGGGLVDPLKPALICGAGTGLGVAVLAKVGQDWEVLPGEGGHMDFAPNNSYEIELWKVLHEQYDHVSNERILSGPGLIDLHAAICKIEGIELEVLDAEQITQLALNVHSSSCQKTLQVFCAVLGSFCGSLALATASFGGVYIAGGIVPSFVEFLKVSEFRNRFEAKGRYQSYNEKIPTFVITAQQLGLLGAAAYLERAKSQSDRLIIDYGI